MTTPGASESARAASALCIGLLAGQRPSIPIPPSVVESIAGMLVSELDEGHRLASYAAEALGALSGVPSAERQFGDQGVVELLVVRAGTGDTESCTSAATVLASLARRRRCVGVINPGLPNLIPRGRNRCSRISRQSFPCLLS